MEKMSFIFFIIIVFYLIISFLIIKNKKTYKIKLLEEKLLIINENDENDIEKNILAAIAAVVATAMAEKPYVLKRVYLKGEVDEKKSYWKVAARNESMNKRAFFK